MASSKIFFVASLLIALMFPSMITSSRAAQQFTEKQKLKPKFFRPHFPQFPRPGFPSNPTVPSFPQFPRPSFPTNPMPFPQFPRPGFPSNPTPGFPQFPGQGFPKFPFPSPFPQFPKPTMPGSPAPPLSTPPLSLQLRLPSLELSPPNLNSLFQLLKPNSLAYVKIIINIS
ncbi:LOW QUALITY PROTEIN: prophenin-2 [Arabidopsis lyrata subsp. lyrata]|uniref:LOW QUALITY PROTEIN: prophenin-2 n=1 Tax=Arabidopsis lyrata subsp. lyrata TaxID=81972 RepID=UPI000A29DB6F|nr:LOW QUALITY PROTEIN: prophenin-2 [Arabidopsis lyrata subsp. lyrata]|eukprot:XP_002867170.2 LOW QUALITY PROTEIN: prophenin-2 [Arabidopsis lyrata subsp. lyrata]